MDSPAYSALPNQRLVEGYAPLNNMPRPNLPLTHALLCYECKEGLYDQESVLRQLHTVHGHPQNLQCSCATCGAIFRPPQALPEQSPSAQHHLPRPPVLFGPHHAYLASQQLGHRLPAQRSPPRTRTTPPHSTAAYGDEDSAVGAAPEAELYDQAEVAIAATRCYAHMNANRRGLSSKVQGLLKSHQQLQPRDATPQQNPQLAARKRPAQDGRVSRRQKSRTNGKRLRTVRGVALPQTKTSTSQPPPIEPVLRIKKLRRNLVPTSELAVSERQDRRVRDYSMRVAIQDPLETPRERKLRSRIVSAFSDRTQWPPQLTMLSGSYSTDHLLAYTNQNLLPARSPRQFDKEELRAILFRMTKERFLLYEGGDQGTATLRHRAE
ncbi:hypothetical protein BAUCODRAFT_308973 [Baudoinia panamericana UAMH 10762]|uniref:Uncharacterized protein n=1 Tax=Baudoinia panamericana (strain UAMH 10762) TaxID=717646 RepID=M2MKN0_BAUPA|nr:uncharacterized protein BAUCODRAFT_308973 [Baudoinia panamericana UAMH 10762]EMC91888.1 hypothetical protein BAUCODRAFT_308973 [Baudoinia panamericana UAMH 10762]